MMAELTKCGNSVAALLGYAVMFSNFKLTHYPLWTRKRAFALIKRPIDRIRCGK